MMTNEQSTQLSPSTRDPQTENRLLIENLYTWFASGDFEKIHQLLHPEATWIQMEGFPGGGVYTGSDNILHHVFGQLKKEWIDWRASVESFVEAKDAVFVTGQYSGRHAGTDKSFTADFIHHYELENRKVVRFKQYTDTAQIVAAASKYAPST